MEQNNQRVGPQQANQVRAAADTQGSEGVSLSAPSYQLQGTTATPPNPVLGSAQERLMTVQYELIAHGFGYTDVLNASQGDLAESMGFQRQWARSTIVNGIDESDKTGFFAGLLLPASQQEFSLDDEVDSDEQGAQADRNPVLAFRGSETGDQFVLDWWNNDMDPIAVGYTAFMMNYETVHNLLATAVQETGKRVVVTGHSLGGSLAKQCALHFPQFISDCITFQAPGINAAQQAYLEQNMNSTSNINGEAASEEDLAILSSLGDADTHSFADINFTAHTAEGDIVNYAGDGRVPGSNQIKHDPSGLTGLTPLAHIAYLTSSSEYSAEHAIMEQNLRNVNPNYTGSGASDLYSEAAQGGGVEAMGIDNPARNTAGTTHETIESIRDGLIAEVFNPHSEFINNFPTRIPQIPVASRTIILQSLLNGPGVIESLTKGAGVGMGIAALISNPGKVLGLIGGAAAGFAEYGGDTSAETQLSTAGGAAAGLGLGSLVDVGLSAIPGVVPVQAVAAPVLGALGGIAYSYYAISNDINNTQEAAFKMLDYSSASERKEMIQGIGGATLFYSKMDTIVNDLFGSDVFERTRALLTAPGGYFSGLNANEAKDEIEKNLEGGIWGFGDNVQEKLISDVLIYGAVGNETLTALGGGDYNEGLEIVLRKLQGREDSLVSDRFEFTDNRWRWFY